MRRKKRAIALSLSLPLLLQGRPAAADTAVDSTADLTADAYPAPIPPGGPFPPEVALPAPAGPDEGGTGTSATAPGGGLPVTGGDVAGLAAVGGGALAAGLGLNRVAARRREESNARDDAPRPVPAGAAPPEPQEDLRVSTDEPQYRLAPEALESDDLLEGVEGPARARLAAVLHSAATSYRATIDELEAARGEGTAAGTPAPADRFAELGDHVAWVLRASHDAAEEERRKAEAEVADRVAAADAEIERRRADLDAQVAERRAALEEDERRVASRLRDAEEEATAIVARAREEAEGTAATIRSDAEGQLSSLLQVQESLRSQLVEASDELRRSLAALAASAPVEASAPSDGAEDQVDGGPDDRGPAWP